MAYMSYELLHMTTKEKEGKKKILSPWFALCARSQAEYSSGWSGLPQYHAVQLGQADAWHQSLQEDCFWRAELWLHFPIWQLSFFLPNGLANVIHPFARQNIHIAHRNALQPRIIYFLASLKNNIYRSILCLFSSLETTRKDWGNWMNIARRWSASGVVFIKISKRTWLVIELNLAKFQWDFSKVNLTVRRWEQPKQRQIYLAVK